jgi:hypothetical protein
MSLQAWPLTPRGDLAPSVGSATLRAFEAPRDDRAA